MSFSTNSTHHQPFELQIANKQTALFEAAKIKSLTQPKTLSNRKIWQ